ncbi:5-formyltetrahydrofolate cyclo-ligase [Clostridia bacterium]|nr:5-formyltetrahydrofolate cyclo-ligase [Clostridia bacterium]
MSEAFENIEAFEDIEAFENIKNIKSIKSIEMCKKDLRRELLAQQAKFHDCRKDEKIVKKLIDGELFRDSDLILTYVSKPKEIDTLALIEHCFSTGKPVAVPKVVSGEYEIDFFLINDLSELEPGAFGVREPTAGCEKAIPTQSTLCVTPALACNSGNFRIGYGKGCYDRYLRRFPGKAVGLCYSENIIDFREDEFFDVQLFQCITNNS